MKKTHGCLLLFLLASNESHQAFARQEAMKVLSKKRGVLERQNNGDYSLSPKALEKLKTMFGIQFNDPNAEDETSEETEE